MLALLEQAVIQGAIRSLDLQFARLIAGDTEPALLLLTACLSEQTGSGHVCLDLNELDAHQLFAGRHIPLAEQMLQRAAMSNKQDWISALQLSPAVGDGGTATPLVLQDDRLYLQRLWHYEYQVAKYFASNAILMPTAEDSHVRIRQVLDSLFGFQSDDIDWQKIAAAVAITRRISVISGGPGTGKTTTVARLLAALVILTSNQRLRIQLAAPTGKAAARLTESLGKALGLLPLDDKQRALFPREAATLHRLLGAQPHSQRMRYHQRNRLHLDVLVIDEASMVDLPMMARLITALPDHARVIFLGDRDQLASVEAGAVLGDLCRFAEQGYSSSRAAELFALTGYQVPEATTLQPAIADSLSLLRKSYRFDAHSGIGRMALAVNQGDTRQAWQALAGEYADISGYPLHDTHDYQQLLDTCIQGYSAYLQAITRKADVLQVLNTFADFQVLCALREGPFGVSGLNEHIENALQRSGLIALPPTSGARWYAGRPVMIGRNDRVLGLFNGDIGIALYDDNQILKVYFQLPDGRVKGVQPSRLPAHETAYAMTVHKSQGSEFAHTVLVLPDEISPLLSRELVYTAITRARQKLSLYASERVLKQAIQTPTLRRSGLSDRLSICV